MVRPRQLSVKGDLDASGLSIHVASFLPLSPLLYAAETGDEQATEHKEPELRS